MRQGLAKKEEVEWWRDVEGGGGQLTIIRGLDIGNDVWRLNKRLNALHRRNIEVIQELREKRCDKYKRGWWRRRKRRKRRKRRRST